MTIRKREWILPYAHSTYEILKDGEVIENNFERLKEVREFIRDFGREYMND